VVYPVFFGILNAQDLPAFHMLADAKQPAIRKEDDKTRQFGEVLSIDIDVMPCGCLGGYKYRLNVIERVSSSLWTFGLENKGDGSTHIEHLINSLKPDLRQVRVHRNGSSNSFLKITTTPYELTYGTHPSSKFKDASVCTYSQAAEEQTRQ